MAEVQKYGIVVPIAENLLQSERSIAEALHRMASATPEQRRQWQREAAESRAATRAAAAVETDIVAGLRRHFGWPPEYVRHLAQPYCDCDGDRDGGWYYCPHAHDLGLDR